MTHKVWKPINYLGTVHYDPRGEMKARTRNARDRGDTMVAVPLALADALAQLTECDSTTEIASEQDGPLTRQIVRCHKLSGHDWVHRNGYTTWENPTPDETPDTGLPAAPTMIDLSDDACCWTCTPNFALMMVCSTCGNKRCPKAADHNLACTGSNEPGQEGSAYPLPAAEPCGPTS